VLNADDAYVSQFGRDFPGKVVTFAIRHPADVRAENIHYQGIEGSTFQIVAGSSSVSARLPLLGEHNIYNVLAAIAVALACGVPLESAAAALLFLAPPDKRGQVLQVGGATVINDCYNSNPKALDSMLDVLTAMSPGSGGRRIVVAGEMLELGNAAQELHRESGRSMALRNVDLLLGVRGAAREMVDAARQAGMQAQYVESSEEAGEWLAANVRPGDVVLLKASRGVRLERALELWTERLRAPDRRESPSPIS
jgi:UDP-N-acetylmuramoyl-tripeptide--D-alanyl-D-alanine ligase